MKTAIVGSRSLKDSCYDLIAAHVPAGTSEVVSGGASGADALAERYARENSLMMTVVRPDYQTYDRHAPLIRNGEIVRLSDYVLVFWDGKSRGSMNVIMTCIKQNKPFRVIMITEQSK